MADFHKQRRIDEFLDAVTGKIASRRVRAEVREEYAAHIEDGMLSRMMGGATEEEAFLETVRALGDPGEYAGLLSDVHARPEMSDEFFRAYLRHRIGMAVGALIAAGLLALFLWLFEWFVVQVMILILAVVYVPYAIRLVRAFRIRRRAVREIKSEAEERGYAVSVNRTCYTSIFRHSARPAITVETPKCVYKIRFLATVRRRRILKFLSPGIYAVHTLRGYRLLVANRPYALARVLMWGTRAKGLPMLYDQFWQVPRGYKVMPVIEKRNDPTDKPCEEALVLSPVPMQVYYYEGAAEVPIRGGEFREGVWIHDMISLRAMLAGTLKKRARAE